MTLIELVVVMVIIAIGATLLTPNIGAWMPIYRLKGATRDVVSTMRVAQIKAVSSNIWYRVSFDPGQGKYFLENSQDLGANWTKEGDDQVLPTGVQFNTSFAGNTAIFYPTQRQRREPSRSPTPRGLKRPFNSGERQGGSNMDKKGFTLIEVLVGLVLLAIGLLAIAGMQMTSVRGNFFSGNMTQASILAQDRLEALKQLDISDAALSVGTS